MKIAVNTRLLIKNKLDGIGWFTFEIFNRIVKNHPEHEFYFLFDRKYDDEFIFAQNVIPVVISPPTRHPVLWYLWFEFRIPKVLKKLNVDIFISPDGFLSLKSKIKSISVIHDINFAHFPKDLPFASNLFYNYFFPRYAKKANRIITVSKYSKQDLVNTYGINPDEVNVLYNAANEIYRPILNKEIISIKNEYTQAKDYFIFIGSLHPRKNVANMLKAFDVFCSKHNKDFKLLIIGNRFFKTKDISETYESMKFKNNVQFLGRLEPNEIRNLLAASTALVLVSKFEGFGIPIVEAMNCDIPSIVSDVSSLPEVVENSALYANPYSVNSIADAMLKMAENEEIRKKLIENTKIVRQKYSWDKSANEFWEIIENLV
ncbi:MAG: glycosyltransferase family 4 protein [Bacteroidales bacterium]|nr:glycosyltransferase family 4 protein [Bacteroidales bacterium]MBN2756857.1 glycosyltransferase family 4 protein [Bacteroidales bacterium]